MRTDAEKTKSPKENNTQSENKPSKKPNASGKKFLWSGYYDTSDIDEAARAAYDTAMDDDELRKKRKKDWLTILIGVPAFIAFVYIIVLIFGGRN